MSNNSKDKMDGILDTPDGNKPAANTGKAARPPKPKTSLGRETKVGLAVIGALLVIFVIVLAVRLRGGADDDVAQNGTSSPEDSKPEKSGGVEKKASPAKAPMVIPAKIGIPPRQADSEKTQTNRTGGADVDSVPGGSRYASPNQAPVQDLSPSGSLPPYAATPASNGAATGGLPAGSAPDTAVENPLRQGQLTMPADSYGNVSPEPSGTGNPFQNRQASGESPSGDMQPQSISPPGETAADEGQSTALEGRRTAETASETASDRQARDSHSRQPAMNTDRSDIEGPGVKLATEERGNVPDDGNLEISSGPLEKVKGFDLAASSTPGDSSIAPYGGDAPAADDPRFRNPRPKVSEPARLDEAIATARGEAPAPLKADSTPTDELYTVQGNETYWTIARQRYGSGAYFKALYEHNRRHVGQTDAIRPGAQLRLPPGAQLRLPDEATLQRLYPALCPRPQQIAAASHASQASANLEVEVDDRPYVVDDGDTLYEIARRQLGKGSRWAEVYDLNRERIGRPTDRLEPGTRLRLPAEVRRAND